jgi:RNA polymerase sigma-70 factor (ECF subfamily)
LAAIPRLRRYARSLMLDAYTADDLVQTTLERALAHWHQFDQRRDLVVWLIGIAHHAHLDELRRSARVHVVEPQAAQAHADARRVDPGNDLGLRIDLLAALRGLPIEQREALLLVAVEQFSYAECANLLHVPVGTVMSRISRGRVALRAALEGRGGTAAQRALRRVV